MRPCLKDIDFAGLIVFAMLSIPIATGFSREWKCTIPRRKKQKEPTEQNFEIMRGGCARDWLIG